MSPKNLNLYSPKLTKNSSLPKSPKSLASKLNLLTTKRAELLQKSSLKISKNGINSPNLALSEASERLLLTSRPGSQIKKFGKNSPREKIQKGNYRRKFGTPGPVRRVRADIRRISGSSVTRGLKGYKASAAKLLKQDNMYFSYLFKKDTPGSARKLKEKKKEKKDPENKTQSKLVDRSIKEEPTFHEIEKREKEEIISAIDKSDSVYLNLDQGNENNISSSDN